jgi:hypothetical protein
MKGYSKRRLFYYGPNIRERWTGTVLALNKAEAVKIINKRGYPKHRPLILKAEKKKWKLSCPNCKSRYIQFKRNIGFAELIIVLISLCLVLPLLPRVCFCQTCGHKWKS